MCKFANEMNHTINVRGRLVALDKPQVMGILNATPDSFYEGSRKQTERDIAERALQIVDEGGTMIDIGAFSTRPGANEVSEEEELNRLRFALGIVRRELPDTIVSVDTYRPLVARQCVEECPEATGYGAIYFVNHMLATRNIDIKGKTIALSGFGNVAWGAAKKATELGAKVITISGPDGYIYDPAGLDEEKIAYMLELRASGNDVCQPYEEEFEGATFYEGKKPWGQKADIYLPCATQNELNGVDADMILANNPICIAEVSNMGCTAEAAEKFVAAKALFAPGKAVNAGGVATSGLEMTQNSMRLTWSNQEVDDKLHYIMHSIHEQCVKYGTESDGYIDYVKGANIAGFMKVANAMMAQGIV